MYRVSSSPFSGDRGTGLAKGRVDGLCTGNVLFRWRLGRRVEESGIALEGHEAAIRHLLARLAGEGRAGPPAIAAGHRVVHGGARGLRLDPARRAAAGGPEACTNPPDAALQAYVIAAGEEQVIARKTASCIARSTPAPRR
jgi:acetate kinase